VHFATDPQGKNRPAVIVSQNGRNQHPYADSVLAIPLSTPMPKLGPWHLLLPVGETGLPADTVAQAEIITAVSKEQLIEPVPGHRSLDNTQVCRLAGLVRIAMGCVE
jgi:mRNA-degrading endonuclease toxin of MazEF toxin-antitoxin module